MPLPKRPPNRSLARQYLACEGGAGFTIVELLISIAIFGILAAFVLVGFRNSDELEKFRLDSQFLASTIRRAQSLALSGARFQGDFPSGGYGIILSTCLTPPCSYQLFTEESTPANQHYDGTLPDQVVQTLQLSPFTRIKTITVLEPDGTPLGQMNNVDISFKPPRPTPFVWWDLPPQPSDPNAGEEGKTVEVVLEYTKAAAIFRTIFIKGVSGQISEYAS